VLVALVYYVIYIRPMRAEARADDRIPGAREDPSGRN
jgi:hypothetical protein